jgi:hypothetical protein
MDRATRGRDDVLSVAVLLCYIQAWTRVGVSIVCTSLLLICCCTAVAPVAGC